MDGEPARTPLRRAVRALAMAVIIGGAWLCVGIAYLAREFACWKRRTEECAAAEAAWTLVVVVAVIAAIGITWAAWSRNRRRVLAFTGVAIVLPAALAGYHAWEYAGSATVTRAAVVVDVRPVERFEGDESLEVCWTAQQDAPLDHGCTITWTSPSRTFDPDDDVVVTIERPTRSGAWEGTEIDPVG